MFSNKVKLVIIVLQITFVDTIYFYFIVTQFFQKIFKKLEEWPGQIENFYNTWPYCL